MSPKCMIDIGLIGTMDYTQLVSFYEASKISFVADGWRVDWYEDVAKLVHEIENPPAIIPPHEFYEKLYQVVDLGLLLLDHVRCEVPIRSVKLYVHNSIVPSYQIHAYHEYICGSTIEVFSEAWNHIKTCTAMLRNIVRPLGLSPTIDTWTVRFASDNGSADIFSLETLKTASESITTMLGDEGLTLDSASIIDSNLCVIKLLKETSEQYLIISFDEEYDFAVSRLYYLMIVKAKVRDLLNQLRLEYVDNWKSLQIVANKSHIIGEINPKKVENLLILRTKIQEGAKRFAIIQSHVELVIDFIEFHLGSLFERTKEDPLMRNTPGVIQSERAHLQLFYMSRLEKVVKRIVNTIKELLEFVSVLSEIYTTYVNLRGHVLIEKLEKIAVIVAVLSSVIAVISLLVSIWPFLK